MATDKSLNDFKHKTAVGVITDVDPQGKTVDIRYIDRDGNRVGLDLPYQTVGLTWGICFMPVKGDRVLIDNSNGERPVIKALYPQNTAYLPYLDPGEMSMMAENGSYLHLKNRRKKIQSTGELIDYDADTGPQGQTDIEMEPGGVTIRARNKQQQGSQAPQWFNHGYLSLFDNGDVALHSVVSGTSKGLLHMDGASGHVWLHAGDGKVQEYIELNPTTKEIVIFSDGDVNQQIQQDWKITVYNNQLHNVGNVFQMNVGIPPASISPNFDNINPDAGLESGDIRIDNTQSSSGRVILTTLGNCDLSVQQGNVNITVQQGNISVIAQQGNIDIAAEQSDVTIQSTNGAVNIHTLDDQLLLNHGTTQGDRLATIHDIDTHIHEQGGQPTSGGLMPDLSGPYLGTARGYIGQN